MKFSTAIGLIGLGYMLRDNQIANRTPQRRNSISMREYFRELAINKLDVLFYGAAQHTRAKAKAIPYGNKYVNYFSNQPNNPPTVSEKLISFKSYSQARAVLRDLEDLIEKYGFATVADLNEIFYKHVDVPAGERLMTVWTDNQYGWRSLFDAKIVIQNDHILKTQFRLILPTLQNITIL